MTTLCSSTTTGNHGGVTASLPDIYPDIVQTYILTRLDGPTLASLSCISSESQIICNDESLWKTLCNSHWPSTKDSRVQQIISTFPSAHRSFFSDSYATTRRLHYFPNKSNPTKNKSIQTSKLISLVDIHYGNEIVYSKVNVTPSESMSFKSPPMRVDLLDPKERVRTFIKFEREEWTCTSMQKNMSLSWILIDPIKKRAVNLSSLRPMQVWQHPWTGRILVNYATIIASRVYGRFVKCGVEVSCERRDGGFLHLRDIGMQLEDIQGNVLSGYDSLEILQEAMEGKRVKGQIGEVKKMHEMFMFWKKYYISN